MPIKLKRHVVAFLRLCVAYVVAATSVEILRNAFPSELLTMVIWGVRACFFAATVWFVWRFCTGFYRDYDFFLDDDRRQ
jgi:hypothetical protein